jgi:excinuclease ABC subunit C
MDPAIRDMVGRLPYAPGVYRFRDIRGKVAYVGRATELRSRVASYWGDLGDRWHLAAMVRAVSRIEAVVCDSTHEAAWLERNLLERSKPRWNRTRGGQESPVYIRLDARPVAPGLRVAYQIDNTDGEVRYFGPYLGGLRARQAVAALHRLAPLAYTGTRMSGSERDMADKRGFGQADRGVLVDTVAAILRRESAAVDRARTELATLRDRAAENLAFELAGQIHGELQSLDWVTSAQQVTTMDSHDVAVCGWADGVLVTFSVRAGRLDGWSQRRCGLSRAEPHLAATPGAWTYFAHRNAELAAALAPL